MYWAAACGVSREGQKRSGWSPARGGRGEGEGRSGLAAAPRPAVGRGPVERRPSAASAAPRLLLLPWAPGELPGPLARRAGACGGPGRPHRAGFGPAWVPHKKPGTIVAGALLLLLGAIGLGARRSSIQRTGGGRRLGGRCTMPFLPPTAPPRAASGAGSGPDVRPMHAGQLCCSAQGQGGRPEPQSTARRTMLLLARVRGVQRGAGQGRVKGRDTRAAISYCGRRPAPHKKGGQHAALAACDRRLRAPAHCPPHACAARTPMCTSSLRQGPASGASQGCTGAAHVGAVPAPWALSGPCCLIAFQGSTASVERRPCMHDQPPDAAPTARRCSPALIHAFVSPPCLAWPVCVGACYSRGGTRSLEAGEGRESRR